MYIIFLILDIYIFLFSLVKLLYIYKLVQSSKWLKLYMILMGQSYLLNVSIQIYGLILYIPML